MTDDLPQILYDQTLFPGATFCRLPTLGRPPIAITVTYLNYRLPFIFNQEFLDATRSENAQ